MTGGTTRTEPVLASFLAEYLGVWPPDAALTVVGSEVRTRPGWDGAVRDVVGVRTPEAGVISVRPDLLEAVRAGVHSWERVTTELPTALGRPDARAFLGKFRWSTAPTDLPDAGEWLDVTDPRVPPWLHPFGGQVLVTLIDDVYAAGVGIKRHNAAGLSCRSAPRRHTAARAWRPGSSRRPPGGCWRRAPYPSTCMIPPNIASDRTATAAGFPDLGWQILGVWSPGQRVG